MPGTGMHPAGRPSVPRVLLFIAWAVAATLAPRPSTGTEYHVGPGQPLTTPDRVPWDALRPGDLVAIHWRPEPYRAKWVLCCRGRPEAPIVVAGIPGPNGELPVLDGHRAITPIALDYWAGERGVIKIGPAAFAPDLMPAHLVIENLEIRNARPGHFFVSRQGLIQYSDAASAIYVERGEHVTVRNCVLHDCANGFFTAPETAAIVLDGCHLFDNGMEDSIYQHNAYTESAGMVYQNNRFGPLRSGCRGNNVKDRSSGLVVRYNWIEGGNRQLDLVDAEDSEAIRRDPAYNAAFVYGNVLIETEGSGNNQIVHFGGDNGPEETFRQGPLHFFNNTVVSERSGTTTLLRLSSPVIRARVYNNVLWSAAGGRQFAILDDTGLVELRANVLRPGWRLSHGEATGAVRAVENVETDEPVLRDLTAHDLRLRPDAPGIDRGVPAPAGHAVTAQFRSPRGSEPRPVIGTLDVGAFEFQP